MTPEDRAAQLWFEITALLPAAPKSWSVVMLNTACTAMIVQAINRAIAAEREACAQVAEACECAGVNDIWPAAQRAIAADIRARTNGGQG